MREALFKPCRDRGILLPDLQRSLRVSCVPVTTCLPCDYHCLPLAPDPGLSTTSLLPDPFAYPYQFVADPACPVIPSSLLHLFLYCSPVYDPACLTLLCLNHWDHLSESCECLLSCFNFQSAAFHLLFLLSQLRLEHQTCIPAVDPARHLCCPALLCLLSALPGAAS